MQSGADTSFTYYPQALDSTLLLTVDTVAYLSDGLTNTTTTSTILYLENQVVE